MAAPTVGSDQDIHSRLVSLLDDDDHAPKAPKDSQPTKEGEEPEVVIEPQIGDDLQPDEEPEDETPLVADDEDEAKAAAAAKAEGEEEPEGDEGDDDAINSLGDVAKVFDVEEAEFLNHIQVDTGTGQKVPLSKVISSYRNAPAAVHQWEEFQGERASFQQEATQYREKMDATVRDLAVHAQTLLDITNEEFSGVDWKQLETEDPQTYLILKNKESERGAVIKQAIDKLRGAEQQRLTDLQANSVKTRKDEIAKLHGKMPEWSDKEKAQEAMSDTQEYLVAEGFNAEEINGIQDHRYLLTAWKAAQYDKLKQQAPKKLQKLRGLPKPKTLRSGARRDTSGDERKKAQANFDRLKKTGDERDAARRLEEFL
jgi:hypothetical protein